MDRSLKINTIFNAVAGWLQDIYDEIREDRSHYNISTIMYNARRISGEMKMLGDQRVLSVVNDVLKATVMFTIMASKDKGMSNIDIRVFFTNGAFDGASFRHDKDVEKFVEECTQITNVDPLISRVESLGTELGYKGIGCSQLAFDLDVELYIDGKFVPLKNDMLCPANATYYLLKAILGRIQSYKCPT